MEERERPEEYGSDVKMSTPFLKKLDNYWYHYKWHTIAALIGIFIVLICCLQLCSRQSFDLHIIYAGHHTVDRGQSDDGSLPEYNTILSSLNRLGEDYDGDGQVSTSFATHLVMSEAKRQEIEKETGNFVSESLIASDRRSLYDRLGYSEYYLCLMSAEVWDECMAHFDTMLDAEGVFFVPLAQFLPEGKDVKYHGKWGSAIYLSSLPVYDLPGICELPEDTVIALRFKSDFTTTIDKDTSNEYYRRSVEALKRLLAYEG